MLFTNRRTDSSDYITSAEGENNNNCTVVIVIVLPYLVVILLGTCNSWGLVTSVFLGSFKLLVEPWRA